MISSNDNYIAKGLQSIFAGFLYSLEKLVDFTSGKDCIIDKNIKIF